MNSLGIFGSFITGWALAIRHPTLIFLKWVVNLAFALFLVGPILELLGTDLNHSVLSDEMFGSLNWLYSFEFTQKYAGHLAGIKAYALPLVLVFLALNIWLNGGILEAIQKQNRSGWRDLFKTCSSRFIPLVLVLAYSLALGGLLVGLPLVLWSKLGDYAMAHWTWMGVKTIFIATWGGLLLILVFPGSWVIRAYDYARLLVCAPCDKPGGPGLGKTTHLFWRALVFNRHHHFGTFFVLVAFLAVHLALFPLFNTITPYLGIDSTYGFWAELGASQLLILARITASLATMAGQWRYMQGRMDPVATPPTPEPAVGEPTPEPEPVPQETPEELGLYKGEPY